MRQPVLPMRDGVKPSYLVLPHDVRYSGGLLIDFLCVRFPFVTREQWCARLNSGCVVDSLGAVLSESSPYVSGMIVYYYRQISQDQEPQIPFELDILAITENLIVVDKPHFLPVIPSGRFLQQTLLTKLRLHPDLAHLPVQDFTPIHRLDKDTAGVMLFSHNRATRAAYQTLFAQHKMHKVYEAVAPTRLDLSYPYRMSSRLSRAEAFYLTQTTAGEPNAHTDIEWLAHCDNQHSLYRLRPITGKKHQLRVHMMELGMPLCNDGLYPTATPIDVVDYGRPLQLLARSIAYLDPITHQSMQWDSLQTLAMCTDLSQNI